MSPSKPDPVQQAKDAEKQRLETLRTRSASKLYPVKPK